MLFIFVHRSSRIMPSNVYHGSTEPKARNVFNMHEIFSPFSFMRVVLSQKKGLSRHTEKAQTSSHKNEVLTVPCPTVFFFWVEFIISNRFHLAVVQEQTAVHTHTPFHKTYIHTHCLNVRCGRVLFYPLTVFVQILCTS